MKHQLSFWIICLLALLLAGCQTQTAAPSPVASTAPTQAQLANPASENCIAQGGTHQFETRGDDGQFGVCFFEDNFQCEEWALLNGDCPVGGIKVTGYITPAARYCAITGGTYAITGNSGTDDEQGTCTFKNGVVCEVWAYYNGKCEADAATTGEWQTYTNGEVDLNIQAPPTWSQQMLPTRMRVPSMGWPSRVLKAV